MYGKIKNEIKRCNKKYINQKYDQKTNSNLIFIEIETKMFLICMEYG